MINAKSFLTSVVLTTALISGAGANASVIDTIYANPDLRISPTESYTFVHNFTDQGFIPGVTRYDSGTLAIRLTDTQNNETGNVNVASQSMSFIGVQDATRNDPAPAGTYVYLTLDATSLADLNLDGMISVSVTSTRGNFFFADSTLTVEPMANAVPEPMSAALIGMGFLGIGAVRRRKK